MNIVIGGAGEVGSHLAALLSSERHQITVIDHDEARLQAVSSNADLITVQGATTSIDTLHRAEVGKADLYIAVSPAEAQDMNVVSAALAKRLGAKKSIARINNDEYLQDENQALFSDLGIDYLFYPEKIASQEIANLLQQTYTDEIMEFSGGKLQLVVFKLNEGAPLVNKKISEVTRRFQEMSYRPLAVLRSGETIIPRSSFEFRVNDSVYVISNRKGLADAIDHAGKKNIDVRNIMILGGNRTAEMIAKNLEKRHSSVKLIETNRWRAEELAEVLTGTLVINGDVHDTDLLEEEALRKVDVFIAVSGRSETNILSCIIAKGMGVQKTIAEIENMDYIKLAESLGINTIINKKLITAGRIFRFTMSHNVQSIKYLNNLDAELLEFIVKPGSAITKGAIRELDFPRDAIIGGIVSGEVSTIADGDSRIKAYDRVVVFALPTALPKVNKFFD